MYLRPYIDFSAHTPYASQTVWSVSARRVKFRSCLAQKFRCDCSLSGLTPMIRNPIRAEFLFSVPEAF